MPDYITLFWILFAKHAITLHIIFCLNPNFTFWSAKGGRPVSLFRKASSFHISYPGMERDATEVLSLLSSQPLSPFIQADGSMCGGDSHGVARTQVLLQFDHHLLIEIQPNGQSSKWETNQGLWLWAQPRSQSSCSASIFNNMGSTFPSSSDMETPSCNRIGHPYLNHSLRKPHGLKAVVPMISGKSTTTSCLQSDW